MTTKTANTRRFARRFFDRLVNAHGARDRLMAAGFGRQQVANWICGGTPHADSLGKIADVLEVEDMNAFFERDGQR